MKGDPEGLGVLRFIQNHADRKHDREYQLHLVGDCDGESGRCKYCDEEEEKEIRRK